MNVARSSRRRGLARRVLLGRRDLGRSALESRTLIGDERRLSGDCNCSNAFLAQSYSSDSPSLDPTVSTSTSGVATELAPDLSGRGDD